MADRDTPSAPTSFSAEARAVFASLGEGDGVIVDTHTAFYFGLNRTAAFLWKLLIRPEGASLAQMVDALTDKFAVERADAERDAARFLEQVVKAGLARTAPPPDAGTPDAR